MIKRLLLALAFGCVQTVYSAVYQTVDKGTLSESNSSGYGSIKARGYRGSHSTSQTGTKDVYIIEVPEHKSAKVTIIREDYSCVGGTSLFIANINNSHGDMTISSKLSFTLTSTAKVNLWASGVGRLVSLSPTTYSDWSCYYTYTISVTYTTVPYVTVSPTSKNFGSEGGFGNITVTCNSLWTASTSSEWIVLTNNSGSGNGSVSYKIRKNDSAVSRDGTVTITSGDSRATYSISQLGDSALAYTVVFDANGGSGYMAPQICTASVPTQLHECKFTRSNYTFLGWSVNDPEKAYAPYPDCGYVNFINAAGKTYTLYAVWKRLQYTVTFNANGGTVAPTTISVANGNAVGDLPTPIRTGYTFIGWWTSASGGVQIQKTTGVYADVTYYAHWVAVGKPIFSISSGVLESVDLNGATEVTIPDVVTHIGWGAFNRCSALKSVTIPDSVTSIGDYAFHNCSGLTSVTIGNGVTSIGERAFYGCSGITSVKIPNSVTNIGYSAFSYCRGLTSVTIGNGVTSIGEWAFYGCSEITSVTIGQCVCNSKLSIIFSSAYKTVTNVVISDSVTSIGESAFEGCTGLRSVTIPKSVTRIEGGAFMSTGLRSVIIPNSVTSIGEAAFAHTGLRSVTIPKNVKSIGAGAFGWCGELKEFLVASDNANYVAVTGLLFTKYGDTLVAVPAGLTGITIPTSVKNIGDGACAGCSAFTRMTIPIGIRCIGEYAFSDCHDLTSVTIPNSVTNIGYKAFSSCSGLTSVTIPDSMKNIVQSTFSYCSGLTSVAIPNSVTNIEWSAFWGTRLTMVHVKKGDTNRVRNLISSSGYDVSGVTFVEDLGLYKVTFNANGGTASSTTRMVESGKQVGILPTPTRTGYTFAGWYTAKTGGTKIENTTIVKANVTYYAHWTANKYKVTLDGQGATAMGTASATSTYGLAMPKIAIPKRPGYTFGGYFSGKNGSGTRYYKADGTSARAWNIAKPVTLYAKWTANKYEYRFGNLFSFHGWAGSSSAVLHLPDDKTQLDINKDDGAVKITTGANAIKYTAYSLTPETYSKFYKIGMSEANAKSGVQWKFSCKFTGNSARCAVFYVEYDGDKKIIMAGNRNYHNMGWVEASKGSYIKTFTVSPNCRALQFFFDNGTANSEVTFSDIWFAPADREIPSPVRKVRVYSETGAIGALPAVPTRVGQTGTGWYSAELGACIAKDTLLSSLGAGDKVFTAKYTPKTSTLKFSANGGKGTMTTGLKATYGQAMPGPVAIPTRVGYAFAGFFDQANGGVKYYYSSGKSAAKWDKDVTTNTTLHAHWTVCSYAVTLNGQDATTAGTASVKVAFGAALPQIEVPTKLGYAFGGYFDGKDGTGTKYYYSSGKGAKKWDKAENTTLYAKWTPIKYKISFNRQGATFKGTDTVTATYGVALPQITIPSKTGYTFSGYFAEPNGKGTKYYYSSGKGAVKWDQTANATLYARWTKAKTIAKLAAKLGSTATTDEAADEPTFEIEEGVLLAVEPNGLTEIEVPDTVTIIGEAAFVGCTEVERVILPETVQVIGEFAFFGCAALEELVLPTGELEVSATAFLGCPGLADEDGTVVIDGIPFDCRNPLE